MGYILVDKKCGAYIGMKGKYYMPITDRSKARRFDTAFAATKVFTSSVSKQIRTAFNFEALDENIEFTPKVDAAPLIEVIQPSVTATETVCAKTVEYTPINLHDVLNTVNTLANQVQVMASNEDWLNNELVRLNKDSQDVLHYLENTTLSASDGYKVSRLLQLIRQRRRRIKNELQLLDILKNDKRDELCEGITGRKISKTIEDWQYSPRAMDELFEKKNIDQYINKYAEHACENGPGNLKNIF